MSSRKEMIKKIILNIARELDYKVDALINEAIEEIESLSEHPPKPPTKTDCVLNYLQAGNGITKEEANAMFGCASVSTIVSILRKRGHDICSELVSVDYSDKKVVSYFLKEVNE